MRNAEEDILVIDKEKNKRVEMGERVGMKKEEI